MNLFNSALIARGVKGLLASIRDTRGEKGRYYRWGKKDNFPNVIIDGANNSPTANTATDILETFLEGQGLRDKQFEVETMLNPHENMRQFKRKIDTQLALFPAITARVKFNNAGEPQSIYFTPIQWLRKRYDGKYIYQVGLGDDPSMHYMNFRKYILPDFIDISSPSKAKNMIKKQINDYGEQLGAVVYIYRGGQGSNYQQYPVPKWAAGLNDLNADAGLSLQEESQVANSFKGAVIIETETLDRSIEDEEGLTEYDRVKQTIEDFTKPDGSPVLLLEGQLREAVSKITPLNIQHQMDATEKATDRIAKKIFRHFSVPPILAGIETAGKLGNQQELINYMKLFSLHLNKKWELFYEFMHLVFPKVPQETYQVQPLNLFDFIPDKVIDKMTVKQINEAFNLPEDEAGIAEQEGQVAVEKVEVNEHLKTLTGRQQQQLERIVRKFSRDQLTEAQAILQLSQGFGFTEEQARIYLNIADADDNRQE